MWILEHRFSLTIIIAGVAFLLAVIILTINPELAGGSTEKSVAIRLLLSLVGLTAILKGFDIFSAGNQSAIKQSNSKSITSKSINLMGAINAIALLVYTIIAYGLTPRTPTSGVEWYRVKLATRLAEDVGFFGPTVSAFVAGENIFTEQTAWLLAYLTPLAISTVVFLVLLILIARNSANLNDNSPKILFRWAVVFTAITIFAPPVLVLDFWYPLAWGRMVAAGMNPYHMNIPLEFIRDLPMGAELTHVRMMYGPLWAIGYGVVMWIADRQTLLAALIFKLLFAAAWIGSLKLIWELLKRQSLWHQCVGLLIFGWMPLGVMQGVAEGHNDVFMIFFILLWLYYLERDRERLGSLSLAASVLIKYISAPLFLLDFIHFYRIRDRGLIKYFVQIVPANLVMAITLGLFFRSPEFFSYFNETQTWYFYTPREAFRGLVGLVGIWIPYYVKGLRLLFILIGGYYTIQYWRKPTWNSMRLAVLAVMTAMLFGVASHVWPWYLIWVLGPAALVPGSALGRWAIAVALVTPLPILVWVVYPEISHYYIFELPAMLLYSFAVLWVLFVPRRWFPTTPSTDALPAGIRPAMGES